MASFISLLIVFLQRAYSTHGLLEIDFHPAWMLLNLGLIFVEIAHAVQAGALGAAGSRC